MGKKTLEQEYKARLQETIDLREQLEAKERELMKHGATTADLQEVITNQNGEKETLEKVTLGRTCDIGIGFIASRIRRIEKDDRGEGTTIQ